jgi:hypothetical protein
MLFFGLYTTARVMLGDKLKTDINSKHDDSQVREGMIFFLFCSQVRKNVRTVFFIHLQAKHEVFEKPMH